MAKEKAKEKTVFCPYCDSEIAEANLPYCQSCQVTIFYCPKCRKPVSRENKACPHCGAKIEG